MNHKSHYTWEWNWFWHPRAWCFGKESMRDGGSVIYFIGPLELIRLIHWES